MGKTDSIGLDSLGLVAVLAGVMGKYLSRQRMYWLSLVPYPEIG